jgi:hypothetical protein
MKNSKILWLALLATFCVVVLRLRAQLADFPFQVKPNWSTIIPFLVLCAAYVGLIIRREVAAPAETQARKANTQIAAVGTIG